MATAMLMEPKARSANRSALDVKCTDSYRLPHDCKRRVQQALDQRIEYIVGDGYGFRSENTIVTRRRSRDV